MAMSLSRNMAARVALALGIAGLLGALIWREAFDHRLHVPMMVHSKFFSIEVKLPEVIDPQVFVADSRAEATVGAQGIARVAGVRPATSVDPSATEALTADGRKLGFTIGAWFGATGESILEDMPDGREKISTSFAGLVPGGVYCLFENHFDRRPVTFTPLDGTGTTNQLRADDQGRAQLTVIAPQRLTHDNAVLLVYDSDGHNHGMHRGQLGINAHHQMVGRIPAE